ncbi:LysR family transcriptional regulator, glycine cleavage system transcriptional activator [Pseudonocardia thermophila]|uniref:LysR family transcriptional regulator, glycine cleavage system transcriptional activator n=1 Tax=Pseudonocardia thermophila TaxID=1848 RepID=A0A1M6T1V1_PSETH|nr:LysR substrate-binding domain-containing protein [Pseudonocardia thermophila]SHK50973.1 LysR family transcriptional regulator, glycine cleavage system transcriptional activator [Pseudonocardia thermophila]
MSTHRGGGGLHLPPLNALRSFEAAGRLGSIRAAAAELYVTPGAVSRQVRALESWLGVALFRHEGRTIRLTDVGARYLRAVTEHLTAIADATGQVSGRWRPEEALNIRSYTLLASTWLVPRLNRFRRSQPWIELDLVTSSNPADFGRGDVDAEIRPAASGPWPGSDADLVVDADLVLVCSPSYVAEYRLAEPADLKRLPGDGFLRSAASPHLWQMWFDAVGLDGVTVNRGPSFGDSTLAYQTATAGHGVMLAPLPFIEPDLASGRLVMPFPDVPRPRSQFYLVYPADRPHRKAFTAFRKWLLAEGRPTLRASA